MKKAKKGKNRHKILEYTLGWWVELRPATNPGPRLLETQPGASWLVMTPTAPSTMFHW